MTESLRPLPVPTPETQHFWDGTRVGELRLQQCNDCQHTYFPPRPFCPECSSRNVQIVVASGRATLESYVISHRPHKAFTGPRKRFMRTMTDDITFKCGAPTGDHNLHVATTALRTKWTGRKVGVLTVVTLLQA